MAALLKVSESKHGFNSLSQENKSYSFFYGQGNDQETQKTVNYNSSSAEELKSSH